MIYITGMLNRIRKIINNELPALLAVSAALFVFIYSLGYLVFPLWGSLRQKQNEIAQYKGLLSSSDGYATIKEGIKNKHALLEKKLEDLSTGFADPQNFSGLLQMLIAKADNAGIRFVRMEPEEELVKKDYILYPVTLEMSTNYNSFGQFVSSLEATPQLVSVDRLGIAADEGPKITATIRVTCFLRPRA
ncbi:MAG: type 4a pilus biogenesis protein PilO [Chitinivibrionales bacterium]|nr:type 4a pilus biogenesis protein PilO [Chitinivibrionales bacterium]